MGLFIFFFFILENVKKNKKYKNFLLKIFCKKFLKIKWNKIKNKYKRNLIDIV